jgi:hypothetical protein
VDVESQQKGGNIMKALKTTIRQLAMVSAAVVLFMGGGVANATTVDLTAGGFGTITNSYGTARFDTTFQQPTGSGVIDSFVRLSDATPNGLIEEGYNTSGRPLQYDENSSPTFTHDLLLSAIPIVDIDGTFYRAFLLDINQLNSDVPERYLSLDQLKIFINTAGGLNPTDLSLLGTKIYDLGTGNDVWLNYDLNKGSGSGDMVAYIPSSLFTGGDFVYFWSSFGATFPNNDGYEEWAVHSATPPPVPEPGTMMLLGIGMLGLAVFGKRRMNKEA